MATFGTTDSSVAEGILNAAPRSGGSLQVPVSLTPETSVGILTRTPGAFDPSQGAVCVTKGAAMLRAIYKSFIGKASTAISFPYVLSDDCPSSRYRVVLQCDLEAVVSSSNIQPSLFLIPPGPRPSLVDGTDPFFLDYSAISAIRNYGPVKQGIRVDQTGVVNVTFQTTQPGQQVSMMPPIGYILVPPGWALMGYDLSGAATVPNAGAQLELRIMYAEFSIEEEFSL